MRSLLIALALAPTIGLATAEADDTGPPITTSLALTDGTITQMIDIGVTIDGQPFNDYWNGIFDELFAFADVDQSGSVTADEFHLLPSSRAMRLALGSGFTPPVADSHRLDEIAIDTKDGYSRDDVRRCYRAAGVGCIQVGHGALPHSDQLAYRFIEAVDHDQSGALDQQEMEMAEQSLRKLDTNDDELISAAELIPNLIYPGCAATNPARLSADAPRSVIQTDRDAAGGASSSRHLWNISLSAGIDDKWITSPSHAAVPSADGWTASGSVPELFHQFAARLSEAATAQHAGSTLTATVQKATEDQSIDEFSWLVPITDRDSNGQTSADELSTWLEIQRKIAHGQVLVSVLSGGGLFERLDQNHDSALSVRELRNGWNVLQPCACAPAGSIDLKNIPQIAILIVSRGYPSRITRANPCQITWFCKMDRNGDGDLSRREFIESTERFAELDQNHDDLISAAEAETVLASH